MQWLTRIQQKPRSVRQSYALFFAALSTLVLVAFWSVSLPARLSVLSFVPVGDVSTSSRPVAAQPEIESAFSRLSAYITNNVAAVRQALTTGDPTPLIDLSEPLDVVSEVASSTGTSSASWSATVTATRHTSTGTPVLIGTTTAAVSKATTSPAPSTALDR